MGEDVAKQIISLVREISISFFPSETTDLEDGKKYAIVARKVQTGQKNKK